MPGVPARPAQRQNGGMTQADGYACCRLRGVAVELSHARVLCGTMWTRPSESLLKGADLGLVRGPLLSPLALSLLLWILIAANLRLRRGVV